MLKVGLEIEEVLVSSSIPRGFPVNRFGCYSESIGGDESFLTEIVYECFLSLWC